MIERGDPVKKQEILSLGRLLSAPVFLILLGLLLMVDPYVVSAMIAGIVGYILIIGGVIGAVATMFASRGKLGKALFSVALAALGIWLVQNPLVLAAGFWRFVGILVLINSLPDLVYARKQGRSILLQGFSVLAGVVLILLPVTISRLAFTLCGVVVLVIGVLMAIDRIRGRRWLAAGEDPNIIDAL